MIYEMVYTSAPKGLFTGNTGFSVVGCTRNIDSAVCKQMENLSAYTPFYPHYDSLAWNNPVNYAHRIVRVSGSEYHVLSRICFNGLDYTQRSNKLASHIAVSADELHALPSGPASVFSQGNLFKDEKWQIKTEYFDAPPMVFDMGYELAVCKNWAAVSSDAGWAGVIAESYLNNPQKNIYIVFDPQKSSQNLALVTEVLSLLPVHVRWQLTFSTYFTELPAGTTCNIRFCLPSCEALTKAKQIPSGNLIIDLTAPMPQASGGDLVTVARTGQWQLPQASFPAENNNIPVSPLASFTLPPPQPPVIVQQNGGIKAAMIIAFVALGVLGAVFLITKNSDNNKIKDYQRKLEKNKNLTELALQNCHNSLQIRIRDMKHASSITIGSPIITVELREKVNSYIKNYKPDKKGKIHKKTLTEVQNFYRQIEKKLSDQRFLLTKLNRIIKIAQQERDLIKDIREYDTLLDKLGTSVHLKSSSLAYTATIKQDEVKAVISIVQDDSKKLEQCRTALRKKFPIKTPAKKNNIPKQRSYSVNQTWSLQKDLLLAIKSKKVFSAAFRDLKPDAQVKSVYWGKDNMKNDKGVYSFEISKKVIKFKISLKNKVLHIQRVDKETINIKDKDVDLSILLSDNQWLNFFIGQETKFSFSDTMNFSIKGNHLQFKFPIPEDLKKLPEVLSKITAELIVANKKFNLGRSKQSWEYTGVIPIPEIIQNLLTQHNALLKLQAKLEKDIAAKIFSPEIESTEAFKKYDKTKKTNADTKQFIHALTENVTIGKLGMRLAPKAGQLDKV